jgi:CheY-like chemotaxis protein
MAVIVVIDDHEPIRRLIRRILSKEGHDIFEAADGTVVSDLLHQHALDLVITDIFMPNRDGIEVVRDIRRLSPKTKIVAMTGSNEIREELYFSAARALGADATITKPFRADVLRAMVRRLLADEGIEKPSDQ